MQRWVKGDIQVAHPHCRDTATVLSPSSGSDLLTLFTKKGNVVARVRCLLISFPILTLSTPDVDYSAAVQ